MERERQKQVQEREAAFRQERRPAGKTAYAIGLSGTAQPKNKENKDYKYIKAKLNKLDILTYIDKNRVTARLFRNQSKYSI